MDLASVVQAVSVGLLFWVGRSQLEAARLLAVHDEKHKRHDARLDKLEDRHTCQH